MLFESWHMTQLQWPLEVSFVFVSSFERLSFISWWICHIFSNNLWLKHYDVQVCYMTECLQFWRNFKLLTTSITLKTKHGALLFIYIVVISFLMCCMRDQVEKELDTYAIEEWWGLLDWCWSTLLYCYLLMESEI